MRAGQFKCRHCRRFHVATRPEQKYCGAKACQAARKRGWSRSKYASDPDYRANQKESTAAWLESQGGAAEYYREYRRRRHFGKHQSEPKTVLSVGSSDRFEAISKDVGVVKRGSRSKAERGPSESGFAPGDTGSAVSANSDAESRESVLKTGRYKILPAGANKDAILVEIRVISA